MRANFDVLTASDEDASLLGCYAISTGILLPTFRRSIVPPSMTLKIEALLCSETSVPTSQCNMPENLNRELSTCVM
jgi:hypothetical protein